MKRLIGIATLALAALAARAESQATPAPGEPSFQGRPLSAWVADLRAPAPYTRAAAAYALASLGPAAKPAVPALIAALGDEMPTVRFPVAYALGEIGAAAAEAVPALTKVAEEDRNDDVAFIARKSVAKIQRTPS